MAVYCSWTSFRNLIAIALRCFASRWNPDRASVTAYMWDLEHIQRTNRWEILGVDHDADQELLKEPLLDHPGTTVLWERLDRILGYEHPYG